MPVFSHHFLQDFACSSRRAITRCRRLNFSNVVFRGTSVCSDAIEVAMEAMNAAARRGSTHESSRPKLATIDALARPIAGGQSVPLVNYLRNC